MTNIRKSLLQLVFAGAFMKRWNDKVRPMELLEVDKQAHKMIVAWALFQLNSQGLNAKERLQLAETIIEGGIFDYLYRLVITDIKPPIFYKIKENPEHYRMLTEWVQEQLEPRVKPLGNDFWERLTKYLANKNEGLGERILGAAHIYASSWEFNLIKGVNLRNLEFEEIEKWFKDKLELYADLKGVPELRDGAENPLSNFTHMCGQLRFQKRWSQTPRVPETSVIGHMFIVACYAYFFSMALGACRARRQNNFFAGLFHDLPELLTRDIISPVKKSVKGIGSLIKAYEESELEDRVLTPLRTHGYQALSDRLGYFLGMETGSEFNNTIIRNGVHQALSFEEICNEGNVDDLDPKDGEMLKVCDILAAFIEAYTAQRNGISSDQLQQALWRIREENMNKSLGPDLHIGALLADFD